MKRALEQSFDGGLYEDFSDPEHARDSNFTLAERLGKTLHASRALLRTHSGYFRRLFSSGMRESAIDTVTLELYPAAIVNLLLNYMTHCGCARVYPVVRFAEKHQLDLMEVLRAADYYVVDGFTQAVDTELSFRDDLSPYLEAITHADLPRSLSKVVKSAKILDMIVKNTELSVDGVQKLLKKRFEVSPGPKLHVEIIGKWVETNPDARRKHIDVLCCDVDMVSADKPTRHCMLSLYLQHADDAVLGAAVRRIFNKAPIIS